MGGVVAQAHRLRANHMWSDAFIMHNWCLPNYNADVRVVMVAVFYCSKTPDIFSLHREMRTDCEQIAQIHGIILCLASGAH